MPSATGYVLVSQTHETYYHSCGKSGCGPGFSDLCPYPKRPPCHATCLHRHDVQPDPECLEWQQQNDAWLAAHLRERPTGGTRLGPLHYFSDCSTLLHRGPRREDARIIEIDPETARKLRLLVCKACAQKMAPFEKQFDGVPAAKEKVSA